MSFSSHLKQIQSSVIGALGLSGSPATSTTSQDSTSQTPRQTLRAEQSRHTAPIVASANTTPLMHPLDAPLTARQFPSEFRNYTFAEPIIASFKDASGSRCRAIIARMELQTGPEDGATAKIDMYVTGSDLARCKHPQAKEINDKLIEAHNSQPHAAPQTQTEVRQVQTSASMSAQV